MGENMSQESKHTSNAYFTEINKWRSMVYNYVTVTRPTELFYPDLPDVSGEIGHTVETALPLMIKNLNILLKTKIYYVNNETLLRDMYECNKDTQKTYDFMIDKTVEQYYPLYGNCTSIIKKNKKLLDAFTTTLKNVEIIGDTSELYKDLMNSNVSLADQMSAYEKVAAHYVAHQAKH